MQILLLLCCLSVTHFCFSQDLLTKFEESKWLESPTYPSVIAWWKKMDAASGIISMQEIGQSDAGYPLHLILISSDKVFDVPTIKKKNKAIILINNGIHPGEPDGIDASMLLAKDIVQKKRSLPANIVLAIIPVYNIGGALNRSANYRIDQNGPVEKGFRGNAQNLDLNRDFIKMDSKNAFAFTRIFHLLDPDVFVDNHVSNGADYQHIMTLLASQHDKLGGEMGRFMNQVFEPVLYSRMKEKGYDMIPYVNHFGETPEKGWSEFWDSPRYSSGYATLWNTFAFVPETHMLKPYAQRVEATKRLMECFIDFTSSVCERILQLRRDTKRDQKVQAFFPIEWTLDKKVSSKITFKGYEATQKTSEVSGLPRLYYDRNKPFEKEIPFYNSYRAPYSAEKPIAYVIPQGWWKVIERLQANNVVMRRLTKDSAIEVETYRIDNYQSSPRPYEGHHINSGVKISLIPKTVTFRKGDWYIPMNQVANRFLMETLEPYAEDSYFAWNFFDAVLGQKEGFSDYVFEDRAAELLKKDPKLKMELDQQKATDTAFANSARAQLNFVYQHSPYYEPAHMLYPVYRLVEHREPPQVERIKN